MNAVTRPRMSADEFIPWAMAQPKGRRCELAAGEIVATSPEQLGHVRTKHLVWLAFRDAVRASGLPCEAVGDGLAVRIDPHTVYEPDALLRCGPPLDGSTVEIDDPTIVVEVVSPSSLARDTGAKLEDYFRLASVRHYLILKTESRTVIVHSRGEEGRIETRIVAGGRLALDPPGLAVDVDAFFPAP